MHEKCYNFRPTNGLLSEEMITVSLEGENLLSRVYFFPLRVVLHETGTQISVPWSLPLDSIPGANFFFVIVTQNMALRQPRLQW